MKNVGKILVNNIAIDKNYLIISLAESYNYENEIIKALVKNRNSLEEQILDIKLEKDKLILNLENINFDSKEKGILDISVLFGDNILKLVHETNIKIKNDRYIGEYYKINILRIATAYYTLKDEVAILYGDSIVVLKSFCMYKSRDTFCKYVYENEKKLLLTFNKADFDKDYLVYINEISNENKIVLKSEYKNENENVILEICLEDEQIKINKKYNLFIQSKCGKNITINKVCFKENIDINIEENNCIYNVKRDSNNYIELNTYEKIEFDIKFNGMKRKKVFIDDIWSSNNKLCIKVSNNQEYLFNDINDLKIIIKDIKNNITNEIKNKFVKLNKGFSTISIDLNNTIKGNVFREGTRWKIYIRYKNEKVVTLNEIIKNNNFEDKPKNRYLKPMNLSNLDIIPYISGKKELYFIVGGEYIYNREVYKTKKTKRIIKNLNINEFDLSFEIEEKIENYNRIIFTIIERKGHRKWSKVVDKNSSGKYNVNIKEFANLYHMDVSRWDCKLQIEYEDIIEIADIGYFNKNVLPSYKRYFKSIEKYHNNLITPYLTVKNELAIVIKPITSLKSEKLKVETRLENFEMKKSIINGKVGVFVKECDCYNITGIMLKLRSKTENIEYRKNIKILENKNYINFELDLKEYNLQQFFWDIYIIVNINNEEYFSKIKNIDSMIKKQIDDRVIRYSYTDKNNYIVYPYITLDGALAIAYREKNEYENISYKIKEIVAYYVYKSLEWYFDTKDIWIIYEKFSEAAQDNAFYLFQYCYNNVNNKNIYYVIKKDSPDYNNLKNMKKRVIEFMSFKYMIYMYASKLLVSSESKSHCYAWRVQKGKLKQAINEKKHVFLQHGVTALKRVDYVFNKNKLNAVDLFVATSDYEAKIIEENFGYSKDEIITTGFCRWDVLEDKSDNNKEILLMPTWRNWMDDLPEEKFIQTDYYKNYISLLNSNKLQNLLEKNNIKLNFYIHPKFKAYIDRFDTNYKNIKIYQFGEEKLNNILMKVSMLITDYSSVAWDVYYQKKPVLFYQFDIDDYNKYQGSYLDMENELFGDRSFKVEELVDQIEYYIMNGFKEKLDYAIMRNKYFKYVDRNNCKRTYDTIVNKKSFLYNKRRNKTIYKVKRKIKQILKGYKHFKI